MQYDIFFSISQTPVGDRLPPEADMFRNFFQQVEAADRLGFDTAWIAESHLSSEVQKRHKRPVIPHWKGEVGLNVDVLQL
ncbi:MAG: luciferase, partial [Myxococcota bacterium]|nr:luciferase [Myxococcota bacterium]